MAIVYQHRKMDTNEIFYIGIGKHSKRAYSKSYRNDHWHNIVNKHGLIVEIIENDIDWESAKQKEINLISHYKRTVDGGCLVNQTIGGDGATGYRHTEEWKKENSLRNNGKIIPEYQRIAVKKYMTDRIVSRETRDKISGSVKKIMAEKFPINNRTIKPRKEDLVWINKCGQNARIDRKFIQQYQSDGWLLGRFLNTFQKQVMSKKGSSWMNNGKEQKMVLSDQSDVYLSNGWTFGRLKKENNALQTS